MTNKLSSLIINLSKRPIVPLYLLCVGMVATLVLAAVLILTMVERNQQQWTNEYGQALANLAAHRALDSTLNHDLVSLQVILGDVAENSAVVNATIHDVENNLLVQAGSRQPSADKNRRVVNFSAPITLHNSIAGYVTITINLNSHSPINQSLLWLFTFMAATLTALTLCYGYFTRSNQAEGISKHKTIPIVKSPPGKDFTDDDDDFPINPSENLSHVQLTLCLLNYQELSQQLNSKSLRSINQRLEQQLVGILALYSGKLIHIEQHFVHLRFSSNESYNDAVFKGLCAALLLRQLNQQPASIQLQLSCLLSEDADTRSLLKQLPYFLSAQEDYKQLLLQQGEDKVFVQSLLINDEELSSRLNTNSVEDYDDVIEVIAVQENYQTLLDKQLQQLSRA